MRWSSQLQRALSLLRVRTRLKNGTGSSPMPARASHPEASADTSAPNLGDTEDRVVEVCAPEVPASVRGAALALMQPGDLLWRCPRRAAPQGLFGMGPQSVVVEWWLVDAEGALIEAFWEE